MNESGNDKDMTGQTRGKLSAEQGERLWVE